MKVLAIDPGLKRTGWVVMDDDLLWDWGLFETKLGLGSHAMNDVIRCQQLSEFILMKSSLLASDNPEYLICELPTGAAKSARAMRSLSLVTGVVSAMSELVKCDTIWISPTNVKRAMGVQHGDKRGKDAVIQRAIKIFGERFLFSPDTGKKFSKEKLEHIADALGVYRAWSEGEKRKGGNEKYA